MAVNTQFKLLGVMAMIALASACTTIAPTKVAHGATKSLSHDEQIDFLKGLPKNEKIDYYLFMSKSVRPRNIGLAVALGSSADVDFDELVSRALAEDDAFGTYLMMIAIRSRAESKAPNTHEKALLRNSEQQLSTKALEFKEFVSKTIYSIIHN